MAEGAYGTFAGEAALLGMSVDATEFRQRPLLPQRVQPPHRVLRPRGRSTAHTAGSPNSQGRGVHLPVGSPSSRAQNSGEYEQLS